jgi:hypothetical protein
MLTVCQYIGSPCIDDELTSYELTNLIYYCPISQRNRDKTSPGWSGLIPCACNFWTLKGRPCDRLLHYSPWRIQCCDFVAALADSNAPLPWVQRQLDFHALWKHTKTWRCLMLWVHPTKDTQLVRHHGNFKGPLCSCTCRLRSHLVFEIMVILFTGLVILKTSQFAKSCLSIGPGVVSLVTSPTHGRAKI